MKKTEVTEAQDLVQWHFAEKKKLAEADKTGGKSWDHLSPLLKGKIIMNDIIKTKI